VIHGASGGEAFPGAPDPENFREQRVELLRKSASSHYVEPIIAILNTRLAKSVGALAKPILLGCMVLSIFSISIPLTAQISPGSLSRAHQSISSITQCTSCHELSTGKPTFNCLDCHGEIARRIAVRKGLHATYNLKPGSSLECTKCHSEHNGEDFPLVKWDLKTFDHAQTGYRLEGKHSGLECNRCHTPERVSGSERAVIKVKDLSKTFLGISPSCSNCHQDEHKGRLGPNCLQCHNYSDWKTISFSTFDHSTTRYPLTGLHIQVACQQCHTPGGDKQPRYTGIAFGSCTDCHADPHRGGFSQTCQSCHSPAGWNKISAPGLGRAFDHSQTKFPLRGRHAEVQCVQCHAGGDFKKALAFQKCSDCHRPDFHGGQFAGRAGGSECSSCHTVDGFKPSTFGLKEHAATAYPLQGKHAALQCGQCHIPKGKDTLFKIKFQRCTDCHRDEHAGQFAGAPHFNTCERCHSLQRFLPSTFSLRRHNETPFGLTGSHVAVPCSDCHKQSANFKPRPSAVYHWTDLACTTCHADPHRGRFVGPMRQVALNGKPLGCEACHSAQSWTEFSRFDHTRTAFALTGAHAAARCVDCHKPQNSGAGFINVDFKAAPVKCEACHADIHGMQFAKAGVTPCAGCHNSTKWKPSSFDHDRQTLFALQGAHRNVGCESCHRLTRTVNGRAVVFYKPTPTACASCHGRDALKPGGAGD
jgi:hypothetical protein